MTYTQPHIVNTGRRKLIDWILDELPRESRPHVEAVVDEMVDREWLSGHFYESAAQRVALRPIDPDA